jgi:hypothetical protein
MGPPVAWYRHGRATRITAGFLGLGVALLVTLSREVGREEMTQSWEPYAWLAGAFAIMYLAAAGEGWLTAGETWLMRRQGGNKHWVSLDDITYVEFRDPINGGYQMVLRDADGRELSGRTSFLQGNPDVWQLILDGIERSDRKHGVERGRNAARFPQLLE